MRPPMLLGPSSAHTWSVPGEPLAITLSTSDWAIASVTTSAGMEPSALARWRYIHSSAPSGSAVTFDRPVGPSLSDAVTEAAPAPRRIVIAVAARIGTWVLRI